VGTKNSAAIIAAEKDVPITEFFNTHEMLRQQPTRRFSSCESVFAVKWPVMG